MVQQCPTKIILFVNKLLLLKFKKKLLLICNDFNYHVVSLQNSELFFIFGNQYYTILYYTILEKFIFSCIFVWICFLLRLLGRYHYIRIKRKSAESASCHSFVDLSFWICATPFIPLYYWFKCVGYVILVME